MISPGQIYHKVALLGDSSVGKTSLVEQFCNGNAPQNLPSTIGSMCYDSVIQSKNQNVQLQIWDTAGQEAYRALVPFYVRDVHAALILYDITSLESFNHVNSWLDLLESGNQNHFVAFLVANKIDTNNFQVDSKQAKEFATSHGMIFAETSAKTGEGVQDLFSLVAENVSSLVTTSTKLSENKQHCC